jgi:hypothetical protein
MTVEFVPPFVAPERFFKGEGYHHIKEGGQAMPPVPIDSFILGYLTASIDKMRDVVLIREIIPPLVDGNGQMSIEFVLGSDRRLRVKLEVLKEGKP